MSSEYWLVHLIVTCIIKNQSLSDRKHFLHEKFSLQTKIQVGFLKSYLPTCRRYFCILGPLHFHSTSSVEKLGQFHLIYSTKLIFFQENYPGKSHFISHKSFLQFVNITKDIYTQTKM